MIVFLRAKSWPKKYEVVYLSLANCVLSLSNLATIRERERRKRDVLIHDRTTAEKFPRFAESVYYVRVHSLAVVLSAAVCIAEITHSLATIENVMQFSNALPASLLAKREYGKMVFFSHLHLLLCNYLTLRYAFSTESQHYAALEIKF